MTGADATRPLASARAQKTGAPRQLLPRIVAVAALLVALAWWIGAQTGSSGAARTPEATVDAFYSALRAGASAQALSYLSRDVVVFEMGGVDRSRRDYAAVHLAADMAFAAHASRELESRHTSGEGAWRIVTSTYRELGEGATNTPLLAETAILRQSGDSWQIQHLHWSGGTARPAASAPVPAR